MPPTIDATLTAFETDLYTAPGKGSVQTHRGPISLQDRSPGLNLLASKKDDIDRNVLIPILVSEDIFATFADKREEYKDWRSAWVEAIADDAVANEIDLETVMERQDDQDNQLRSIFASSQEELGEPVVRALMGAISLKKIVRNSTMPQSEGWPEESWRRIAHLFASSELCFIGVLYHLGTGLGRKENIQTLADWSFIYAQDAYHEAGYFGRDADSPTRTK